MVRLVEFQFVGLDLGRDRDHSAFAVAALIKQVSPVRNPVTFQHDQKYLLELTHIEQVPTGIAYTRVMDRLAAIVRRLNAVGPIGYKKPSVHVTVDAAGPGSVATELIRGLRLGVLLHPVIITGGEESHLLKTGSTSVPRKELLSNLRVLLETQTLEIAASLHHTGQLQRECAGVKATGTAAEHDDLVIATALAAWQAVYQCRSLYPKPGRKAA